MSSGRLTRKKLIEYFREGCKPREQWLVGMEVERSGIDRSSGAPIPYDGAGASVRSVLETYHKLRRGDPAYEGDRLVGIAGEWGSISLEPGGQVEWSSPPCHDLDSLGQELSAHQQVLNETGERTGVRWLDVAVVPDHPVAGMPWMPKARYKIMSDYLGAHGRLAHRMMTQTTSIQCAFDFDGPDDWIDKFRAAAILAPVAVALFANSSRVDGADSGWRSYRQAIWRETDPDRCGLPAMVFEDGFGMDAWVDWVARVPAIFQQRARGLVPAGGVPFAEMLRKTGCCAVGIEDWELHLSTIFTEVRSYRYLEVRSADLQPDRRALSVPAFWTGILYHPQGPKQASAMPGHRATHSEWLAAMEDAARRGLKGSAYGRPLTELTHDALALATHGLRNGAACAGGSADPAQALASLASDVGIELPAPR